MTRGYNTLYAASACNVCNVCNGIHMGRFLRRYTPVHTNRYCDTVAVIERGLYLPPKGELI